ncbi:hypothetical protein D3C73_1636350 [compost metagenome]
MEFESANAATSASVGLTPLQTGGTVQEELDGDLANADAFLEEENKPHSLQ